MKICGKFVPYVNTRGTNYIRVPKFVEIAEKYDLEVEDDGTLIYKPVRS